MQEEMCGPEKRALVATSAGMRYHYQAMASVNIATGNVARARTGAAGVNQRLQEVEQALSSPEQPSAQSAPDSPAIPLRLSGEGVRRQREEREASVEELSQLQPTQDAEARTLEENERRRQQEIDKLKEQEQALKIAALEEENRRTKAELSAREALLEKTRLEIANLEKARLELAELEKAKSEKAELEKAQMKLAQEERARLEAEWEKAKMKVFQEQEEKAKLEKAELEKARMKFKLEEMLAVAELDRWKAEVSRIESSIGYVPRFLIHNKSELVLHARAYTTPGYIVQNYQNSVLPSEIAAIDCAPGLLGIDLCLDTGKTSEFTTKGYALRNAAKVGGASAAALGL